MCEGSTLNLSSTSGGTGATYSWTGPNGFTSISRTPSINSPTPLNNGMYIVTEHPQPADQAQQPLMLQLIPYQQLHWVQIHWHVEAQHL